MRAVAPRSPSTPPSSATSAMLTQARSWRRPWTCSASSSASLSSASLCSERAMLETITIGAVAYDPKVVGIWEGMRTYFREDARVPVEVVLFLSYEAQVAALLAGRIDIAWNTNLAYLQSDNLSQGKCRPLAMRDTDLAWWTEIVVRTGSGIRQPSDLRGKRLA